jgi:hypothetical protein
VERKIEVIEYAIKCVFDLPSEGGDPLFISNSSAKQALMDVVAQVFPNEPEPKSVKIHPTKLADQILKYREHGDPELDEDFYTRMFFMILNNMIQHIKLHKESGC